MLRMKVFDFFSSLVIKNGSLWPVSTQLMHVSFTKGNVSQHALSVRKIRSLLNCREAQRWSSVSHLLFS